MKFDQNNLNPIQALVITGALILGAFGLVNFSGGGSSSKVSEASVINFEKTIAAADPNGALMSDASPGHAGSVYAVVSTGITEDSAIVLWQAWATQVSEGEVAQVYFRSKTGRNLGHIRGIKGDPSPTVKLK